MKSMTGYAYKETVGDNITVSVEVKSYNSRFIDLTVNQPYWLSRLENRVREFANSRILRGKVELNIRVKERIANLQVTSDPGAARAYMDAVRQISEVLMPGRPDGNASFAAETIPLSLIIAQEGVLKSERILDMESYWREIEPVLAGSFAEFDRSRVNEGIALRTDIEAMINRIEKSTDIISDWIPEMERIFKENIRTRFLDIVGTIIDDQRILQETAALLIKYSINEEIVRLRAHLASLKKELDDNPAPGRKMDFICQEINREVNTIGSKNQIMEVGQAVIEAKDALENIREQMRNIE
jgi:uncharacterized protein (TIGR00255 family)